MRAFVLMPAVPRVERDIWFPYLTVFAESSAKSVGLNRFLVVECQVSDLAGEGSALPIETQLQVTSFRRARKLQWLLGGQLTVVIHR